MSEIHKTNYRLMTMTVAVALFSGAMAQSVSLLPDVQRLSLPLNRSLMQAYEKNPATMVARDSISLSSIAAGADINRQEKPVMEQLGDGHTLFSLSAESYTRLGNESVVWGDASFVTGSYRSVRWTDCIDYLRLAPYVLGDEVGGNLNTRSYSFAGGYSRSFGRWSAGIHASYRAEIAYRNRDPRVKTVVSDLDITFGADYRIASAYLFGMKAGINVYNQNCDVDFYNPLNEINTYTLTGLGTYYRRFMGNTNKNSGYSSVGYNVGLQWLPVEKRGFAAIVDYNHYRMGQQLRNFNNLTLGFTDNDMVEYSFSYCTDFNSRLTLGAILDGVWFKREGTENLFGNSSGASYDKIGSRSPYSNDRMAVKLSLPLQMSMGGATYLTLSPSVGYESDEEKYTDPLRKLSVTHLTSGLSADFSALSGHQWLWEMSLAGSYSKADASQEILTDLDLSTPLGRCVESNYSMMKADRINAGVSAGVSKPVKKFILSLSVSYLVTDYVDEGFCHSAALTLAAKF